MRTTLAVCGGVGEACGLRSRVGRMKRLLWLKLHRRVEAHMDTEPGVWLTSFQLLDTGSQLEVSYCETGNHHLLLEDTPVSRNTCHKSGSTLGSFAIVTGNIFFLTGHVTEAAGDPEREQMQN